MYARPILARRKTSAAVGANDDGDKLSTNTIAVLAVVCPLAGYLAYRAFGEPPTESARSTSTPAHRLSWNP